MLVPAFDFKRCVCEPAALALDSQRSVVVLVGLPQQQQFDKLRNLHCIFSLVQRPVDWFKHYVVYKISKRATGKDTRSPSKNTWQGAAVTGYVLRIFFRL